LKKKYNEKCDIWSLGVILYILLCGYPPFNGANDKQIIESVLKGKFTLDEPEWDEISADAKDLVKNMLKYDPDKRISASDALQHKWIKTHNSNEKVEKSQATKTL
jgi:calcium-dependent protein kinase